METKELTKRENALQPKDELQPLEISGKIEIADMVKSVGNVKLNEEQKGILFAPVNEEEVEIRPDGLVYLPWVFYHNRLRKAFGYEYALIPKSDPKYIPEANLMVWGFYMVIKGSLMGYALGENGYHPNNPKMSYGDAVEGCKSNALMRLCKDLGISTELWQPEFVRKWKEERAVSNFEYDQKKGKKVEVWRKKTNGQKTKESVQKTTDYLNIENEIKQTIDNPDFTGMIMYKGAEQDLDYLKVEISKRILSGVIYRDIEAHRDNLMEMLLVAKNPKEMSEIDMELSDDNISPSEQGLFQEEQLNEPHEGNLSEGGTT